MKIQSVKEKFPVSVFCITVPHTCTWLMGALRWYAICTRYLESLVFTSLCPSLTQIRGKSQKKGLFSFLSVASYAVGYMNAGFETLSCERCVYAAHIQHESQLSQLVHLNTLRAPCRGVAALEAIWVITAVLSLSSVCQLKHSQVNMTNISSMCGWGTAPLIYCP